MYKSKNWLRSMVNDESKRLMSREEQLQQTAEEWADYYKHAEDSCDYISIRVAYKEGAAWADKHPKNVWHQADEEPQGRDWRILCEDESGKCWVASRRDAFTIGYNWQEFAEDEALTRWAFIKDLLPKGGK